jgi:hypothetical protein
MPEVAQQPPEPLGAAHAPVRDNEDVIADTCSRYRASELLRIRERMSAAGAGRRRQIRVHVEEARARNMAGEVQLAAALLFPELPAAVDELVAQTYQLPLDGGSGTEAGWMT